MRIDSIAGFYTALIRGPYAWPGGYPLYFVMADGEPLAFQTAREEVKRILDAMRDASQGYREKDWIPVALEINWEDSELFCAHTNARIESAYAEPEEERAP
jgi:hypothetical protein